MSAPFPAVLIRAALAVAVPLGAMAAQDPAPSVPCQSCASHGALDCQKHGKNGLELERAVIACSEAAQCKACGGALQVDCKQCTNPAAEAELQRRRELAASFRENRRTTVDQFATGQPLLHVRTEHLDLAYGLKPLTVGREKLDTHAGMHLYAQRIEDLRQRFLTLFEADSREQPERLVVLMCRDQQSHTALSPRFTEISGAGSVGTKQMGIKAVYCMWQDPRTLRDDEELHRNVVHNVSHLLLANLAPQQWLGNRGHGWIDEGLAHWLEDAVTGKCTNFCYEEVLLQHGAGFKGGRWRAPVRRMVDAGELKSFAELSTKNTDQLDFVDHAHAFACVDWLLTAHGGKKFAELVKLAKEGTATRDALQTIYGQNPLAFDKDFTAWVKANYSPQDSR